MTILRSVPSFPSVFSECDSVKTLLTFATIKERVSMAARRISYLIVLLCIVCYCSPVRAELFIIGNGATVLGEDDIFDVFLGGKQFSKGIRLVPVDNAAAQEEFLAKVLHLNRVKYTTHWTKKAFRDGLRQPLLKAGDAETLEFVKRTPGGVGYVNTEPSGVKVIKKY